MTTRRRWATVVAMLLVLGTLYELLYAVLASSGHEAIVDAGWEKAIAIGLALCGLTAASVAVISARRAPRGRFVAAALLATVCFVIFGPLVEAFRTGGG